MPLTVAASAVYPGALDIQMKFLIPSGLLETGGVLQLIFPTQVRLGIVGWITVVQE